MLEVPMGPDGGPTGVVYVDFPLPPSGSTLGAHPGSPKASPARFTGPWVTYRLTVDPADALKSTYVLADGDERDPERKVMRANLSHFLHRRDEG
jgi:hypothetical protein